MSKKNKRFADDGWAIWIDGDDRSTVYINEWLNPSGKSYVDIGIRAYGARQAKEVNVYIPFGISRADITDLSVKLTDKDTLRGVFNTNGIIDAEKNEFTSELDYNGRKVCLISLIDKYMNVRNISTGTVVTVNLEKMQQYITCDEAYVIFRVPHLTLNKVFKSKTDVRSGMRRITELVSSPVIADSYGYSIRINEARLLPDEINSIKTLRDQKIRKVLVTLTIDGIYELDDSSCYRIRRLEKELKKNYAPEDYPPDNAITYEWVEQRNENMNAHYNFYFTISYSYIGKLSIVAYILIIALIGALGSAFYDIIKTLITSIL